MNMHLDVKSRTLNEKQAAKYIGMSRSFLAQNRMEGDLENRTPGPPYLKIGKTIRYLIEDLDAWLLKHRVYPYSCSI